MRSENEKQSEIINAAEVTCAKIMAKAHANIVELAKTERDETRKAYLASGAWNAERGDFDAVGPNNEACGAAFLAADDNLERAKILLADANAKVRYLERVSR